MSVLLLIAGLLPATRTKNALLTLLGPGWRVARSATIRPCFLWRVGMLRAGEGARIGSLTAFRDLVEVDLDEQAVIGQLNWVTGEGRHARQDDPTTAGRFRLGHGSSLTSRHYVDCAGGFIVGAMTIVAGVRSTFLSHWVDHRQWMSRAAPVQIGDFCVISSGVLLTAGTTVADGSVVAAGAVVPKPLMTPATLYAGVPAKPVGDLSDSAHTRRSEPRFARGDAQPVAGLPTHDTHEDGPA